LRCPAGQATNEEGICEATTLSNPVNADEETTLNDALNKKLNRSDSLPVVHVSEKTTMNDGAEITGVTVEGISESSTVTVSSPGTLIVSYNDEENRSTTLSHLIFNLTSELIAIPFVIANSTSSEESSLILNDVTLNYECTPGVSLIIVSGINDLELSEVRVRRVTTNMLKNADENDVCEMLTTSAILSLSSTKATISSSTFENINTGNQYLNAISL
jgi:hypothetical protein